MARNVKSTSSVKLDTFSYTPLDGSASQSDSEQGNKRDYKVQDEEEEEDDDGGGVEEELINWSQREQQLNKRSTTTRWIKQVVLFTIGALAGALLLSFGQWLLTSSSDSPSRPSSSSLASASSSSSSSSSSFDQDFDFTRNPPVRIHYYEEPHLNSRSPLLPPTKCPIPVVYTKDPDSADLVVFNSDSQKSLEPVEILDWRKRKPWQKLVISGVESAPNRDSLEKHFDKLKLGKRNETYDYEMTYRLNSTVPTTYSYGYFNYSNPPVPYPLKRSTKIAASFISNCRPKNYRTLILDELTNLLPLSIDNFGKCHQNHLADETLKDLGKFDQVGKNHNQWNTKITLIGFYKFTIAFENSNDFDYVTEKYYQALERGSVPIVYGPSSNFYETRFFPSKNAGIDVSDYLPLNYTLPSRSSDKVPQEGTNTLSVEAKRGLKKLADRLEYLSSDQGREEYELMLSWKDKVKNWNKDNDDDDDKSILDEEEEEENPLGKIVKLSHGQWEQDCKLAKVYRGGDKEIENIE